jgi:hypothetical protein
MTDKWPSFLAPGHMIVPIIAFGEGFKLPETLNIRESYALGSCATVFQTEVYAIFTCSVLTTVEAQTCRT